MKTKVVVLLLASLLVISACKKAGIFTGSKIYTLNNYTAGYKETFTYNSSDGSIATLVRNDGVKIVYYYSGDTVTAAQVNGIGQTTNATTYIKNSSGYADSAQGEFISQYNSNAYTYDANGMWTGVKSYVHHAHTTSDTYTNNSAKNLVEVQHTNSSNTSTYDYYTYYLSNNNTVGVQNMGQYYLGVSSTNLVQTDIVIGAALDTTDIITYRYRYDGSGNVDTLVAYHRNGTLADSITYTYY